MVRAEAVERLGSLTEAEAVADQPVGTVRRQIARIGAEIQAFQEVASRWMTAEDARERLPDLGKARDAASAEVAAITKAAEALRRGEEAPSSSELAKQARDMIALAALGRQLGLQDGHCPLCCTDQDHANYQPAAATAETIGQTT